MTDFNRYKFWYDPDESNMPEKIKAITRPSFYLDQHDLTNYVCAIVTKYMSRHNSIIELGCGTGRNLAGLRRLGYMDISGVEISTSAIELGKKKWNGLHDVPIWNGSIEDAIKHIKADCIFTVGVLMHIPMNEEWIFEEISKHAKQYIITIELESETPMTEPVAPGGNPFAWARNYNLVFTELGWKEIEAESCEVLMPLLGRRNMLRVFEHG